MATQAKLEDLSAFSVQARPTFSGFTTSSQIYRIELELEPGLSRTSFRDGVIASAEAGAVADKEFRAIQEVSRLLIHMSQ